MSLYDTVLVGDLSKFGIKYVDIECKPDDDLEEMKSVVKETTKKAVCAFELLMSKGRSFPMKRKSRYAFITERFKEYQIAFKSHKIETHQLFNIIFVPEKQQIYKCRSLSRIYMLLMDRIPTHNTVY